MDFTLNEEQLEYRNVIRSFVDNEVRPVAREWELSDREPCEIIEHMKQMGLFGLTVPEKYGGIAVDAVSFAITFEEISRGWMGICGAIGTHSLSCWMIARYGTDDQKERYLPKLATGELRTGIGLTEPEAGSDLQGVSTRAVLEGGHYVVNGTKTGSSGMDVGWITPGSPRGG